jgi:hypothetical protein
MAKGRSPLKDSPLRNPGQSLDEEIQNVLDEQLLPYFFGVVFLWTITLIEVFGAWRNLPRKPWIYGFIALIGTALLIHRFFNIRRQVRALRLGRDGERVVGQYLDGLRENGARIFHDVPGEGFNLDHVVISGRGIYVVETKTHTKPDSNAQVVFDGERVTVAGFTPDRDPVKQATAEAKWLADLLHQSTGKRLPVRGVVLYPGWWVERTNRERHCDIWVLEPKALPAWIENSIVSISPDDVAMAAFHLSRYIRDGNRS